MYSALKQLTSVLFEIDQVVAKRWGRYIFNWGGGGGGGGGWGFSGEGQPFLI